MDIVVGAVIGCDIVEGDDPSACGSGSSSELESELLELLLEEGRFFLPRCFVDCLNQLF